MKVFLSIACLFISTSVLTGQVFVNPSATGNNDGTSWEHAFTDLQTAIDAAAPRAEIWIAAGTYVPNGPTPDSSHFWLVKPIALFGGFNGTEALLNERDFEKNVTLISGDKNGDDVPGQFNTQRSDNAHHVMIVDSPGGDCAVDGLVFRGGTTLTSTFNPTDDDLVYNRWRGGAMYVRSSAWIANCTFEDNFGYQGSGLYALPISGDNLLDIGHTVFRQNTSTAGGACYISGWYDASVADCKYFNNSAGSFGGGLVVGNGNGTIRDCRFEMNTSNSLGGACMLFNNTSSQIEYPLFQFEHCEFHDNTAPQGGGIRLSNFAFSFEVAFDSCVFAGNQASPSGGGGGAVYIADNSDSNINEATSRVWINQTSFTSNSATYGGAVEIDGGDDSLRIEVFDSGFYGNDASDSGGGLYAWMLETANVEVQMERTQFDANTARVGGGLLLDSYFNVAAMSYGLDSCTFSNNVADLYGGGIGQFLSGGPGLVGSIRNSQFLHNQAQSAGGMISRNETLLMENCLFSENYASVFDGDSIGGGGIMFTGPAEITIRNSRFDANVSDYEGAAIVCGTGVDARYENVLFQVNKGSSTLVNQGRLQLLNATLGHNDSGLLLQDASLTEIQNSIFYNDSDNLRTTGTPTITSNGSNISSDATMTALLTGSGNYDDLHDTDPLLGLDLIPQGGSPCIDAGNPQGIDFPTDLAGNPRLYGGAIDIGCYESILVATRDAQWNSSAFTIYPNPVKDIIRIGLDMDWEGTFDMVIYTPAGQLVHRVRMVKTDPRQTFSESIRNLTSGQYVVLVVMGEITYASSIVVQQ